MNPNVSIIILNWNAWENTVECLESIFKIDYDNFDVVIVDNASNNDSVYRITTFFEEINKNSNRHSTFTFKSNGESEIDLMKSFEKINFSNSHNNIIITCDSNYGFAEGNNIGIRFAFENFNPEFILLLNNDTVVEKDFLTELIKVIENDKTIGSVQSLLLKPGGEVIDSLGHEVLLWAGRDKGMNLEYKKKLDEDIEIFGACAAAAIYRSSTLKKVGLFDNDFFTMYEDFDLSWRIRLNGSKSVLAVKSVVYHKRGVSKTFSEIKRRDLFSQTMNGYNLSKNLLIIAIRYNSLKSLLNLKYIYKVIITSLGCIYFSFRVKKVQITFKIFIKNIKLRIQIQKNPLLKNLQNKWTVKKIV